MEQSAQRSDHRRRTPQRPQCSNPPLSAPLSTVAQTYQKRSKRFISHEFLQRALCLAFHHYELPKFHNTYLRLCALLDNTSAAVWNVDINYPAPAYGNYVDLYKDHTSFLPSTGLLSVVSANDVALTVSDGNGVWQLLPYAAIRDCRSGFLHIHWRMLADLYPSKYVLVEVLLLSLTRREEIAPPSPEAELWPYKLDEAMIRGVSRACIRPRRRCGADRSLPASQTRLLRVLCIHGLDLTSVNGRIYQLYMNTWLPFPTQTLSTHAPINAGLVLPPPLPPPPRPPPPPPPPPVSVNVCPQCVTERPDLLTLPSSPTSPLVPISPIWGN